MADLYDDYNDLNDPLEPDPPESDPDDRLLGWYSLVDDTDTEPSEETPLPYFNDVEIEPDFLDASASEPSTPQDSPRHVYKISSAEPDLSNYMMPPIDDPVPEEENSGWKTAWAILREVGETIILTLIIFFLIQTVVRNFRVVGTSMLGNLHDGQYLIIDKLTYGYLFTDILGIGGPQRGDVIVFEPPNRPDDDYVKRVIGLPGETVEIINGKILINGEPLDEPFHPNVGSYSSPPQVVPEGHVFVLGDNRNNSNDSHTWGSLPEENIVGRAWVSYWPPELWGTIPRDAPTQEATLKYLVGEILTPSANAESK